MRLGRFATWMVTAIVCAGATGCRHRTPVVVAPPLPPIPKVEVRTEPTRASGVIPEVPLTPSPLPKKVMVPRARPKKKPVEPVVVASASVPADPVTAPAAPVNVVGSLSAGGDAAPGAKQRAGDAIAEVEKRLAALSAPATDTQREGQARVRNFVKQAREALQSGDAEGAQTLAIKAGVLLDDLTK